MKLQDLKDSVAGLSRDKFVSIPAKSGPLVGAPMDSKNPERRIRVRVADILNASAPKMTDGKASK